MFLFNVGYLICKQCLYINIYFSGILLMFTFLPAVFVYHIIVFSGVLLANKIDLDQRRTVSPKSGKDLAMSHNLEYFECSAVSWLET